MLSYQSAPASVPVEQTLAPFPGDDELPFAIVSAPACSSYEQALAPFLGDDGLPFATGLPAAVLQRLTVEAGDNLEGLVPTPWLWHGKHVTLVDGTTLTMPDTPENQAAYPQLSGQAPGAGFPILRRVVLL